MDEIAFRLIVAALLGAAIGIEREATDQPAGLRTHLTVALGAALFGVISTLGFTEFDGRRADHLLQADVTRVASNVAVGIGFLGAGLIFRQGDTVRNLTTAASMWVVAAIGLAAGVGNPGAAAICTALLLTALLLFRFPRALIRRYLRTESTRLELTLKPNTDAAAVVGHLEGLDSVEVDHIGIRKQQGAPHLIVALHSERGVDLEPALAQVAMLEDVDSMTGPGEA